MFSFFFGKTRLSCYLQCSYRVVTHVEKTVSVSLRRGRERERGKIDEERASAIELNGDRCSWAWERLQWSTANGCVEDGFGAQTGTLQRERSAESTCIMR